MAQRKRRHVGRRRGSDLASLWLWCRPAATAPIHPLAWEPHYAGLPHLGNAAHGLSERH